MKRLMVFVDWFDPAYKAGGPIRTTVNMVRQLSPYYHIDVVTSDRDLHDRYPMPGIKADQWIGYCENVAVFYCSSDRMKYKSILNLIKNRNPDMIYCNGMFSLNFTIFPLLMKRLGMINVDIVLGPHGMLRPSALQFKSIKKKVFLNALRAGNFLKGIVFHATDEEEERDIRSQFPHVAVSTIIDMPPVLPSLASAMEKKSLYLGIAFVGRIHPIKNLFLVLDILEQLKGEVRLEIAGVIEDKAYWNECLVKINKLPANIQVIMKGEMGHEEVLEMIKQVHILFLPTKGENFGHAILEALAAGKPVVISDQTPWRNLAESHAGYDLALHEFQRFREVLQTFVEMDHQVYAKWSAGARNYLEKKLDHNSVVQAYKDLFG